MSVTLHEAIEHAREVSLRGCSECNKEHGQLADWLEELERLRDILGENYNLDNLKEILKEVDRSCRDISNLRMMFGIDTSTEMSEYIRENGARMAELMEADNAGRCVVLPKDGMVYYIEEAGGEKWVANKPIQQITVKCGWGIASLEFSLLDTGKYFTREAAAAALAKEEHHD